MSENFKVSCSLKRTLGYVVTWSRSGKKENENIKAFRVAQSRVLTTTKSRITTFELGLTQASPLQLKT